MRLTSIEHFLQILLCSILLYVSVWGFILNPSFSFSGYETHGSPALTFFENMWEYMSAWWIIGSALLPLGMGLVIAKRQDYLFILVGSVGSLIIWSYCTMSILISGDTETTLDAMALALAITVVNAFLVIPLIVFPSYLSWLTGWKIAETITMLRLQTN